MFTNKQVSLILAVIYFCWRRHPLEFDPTEIVSTAKRFAEFLDGKEKK